MAIITRGILGPISGKIGNVVGSSWKGIEILKTLPISVTNPRTAEQMSQRNKFTGVQNLASLTLSGFVRPIFNVGAQRESGYNVFIGDFLNRFNASGNVITANSFTGGPGTLGNIDLTNASYNSTNDQVSVTWDSSTNPAVPANSLMFFGVFYTPGSTDAPIIGGLSDASNANYSSDAYIINDVGPFDDDAVITLIVAARTPDGRRTSAVSTIGTST